MDPPQLSAKRVKVHEFTQQNRSGRFSSITYLKIIRIDQTNYPLLKLDCEVYSSPLIQSYHTLDESTPFDSIDLLLRFITPHHFNIKLIYGLPYSNTIPEPGMLLSLIQPQSVHISDEDIASMMTFTDDTQPSSSVDSRTTSSVDMGDSTNTPVKHDKVSTPVIDLTKYTQTYRDPDAPLFLVLEPTVPVNVSQLASASSSELQSKQALESLITEPGGELMMAVGSAVHRTLEELVADTSTDRIINIESISQSLRGQLESWALDLALNPSSFPTSSTLRELPPLYQGLFPGAPGDTTPQQRVKALDEIVKRLAGRISASYYRLRQAFKAQDILLEFPLHCGWLGLRSKADLLTAKDVVEIKTSTMSKSVFSKSHKRQLHLYLLCRSQISTSNAIDPDTRLNAHIMAVWPRATANGSPAFLPLPHSLTSHQAVLVGVDLMNDRNEFVKERYRFLQSPLQFLQKFDPRLIDEREKDDACEHDVEKQKKSGPTTVFSRLTSLLDTLKGEDDKDRRPLPSARLIWQWRYGDGTHSCFQLVRGDLVSSSVPYGVGSYLQLDVLDRHGGVLTEGIATGEVVQIVKGDTVRVLVSFNPYPGTYLMTTGLSAATAFGIRERKYRGVALQRGAVLQAASELIETKTSVLAHMWCPSAVQPWKLTTQEHLVSIADTVQLNGDQRTALFHMPSSPVTLVQGMPGTGKSILAAAAAAAVALGSNSLVLVVAGTNEAVDTILRAVIAHFPSLSEGERVIRAGSLRRVHPGIRHLHLRAGPEDTSKGTDVDRNASILPWNPEDVWRRCRQARIVGVTAASFWASPELRCLLGTDSTVGRQRQADLLILDEAGQLGLGAACLPLARAARALVLGDPQQLSPIGSGAGLVSAFEAVSECVKRPLRLQRQYRMCARLRDYWNVLFSPLYEGTPMVGEPNLDELAEDTTLSTDTKWGGLPCYKHIRGTSHLLVLHEQQPNTTAVSAAVCASLHAVCSLGIPPEQAVIICGYHRTAGALRTCMKGMASGEDVPSVRTVDSMQGSSRDCVVVVMDALGSRSLLGDPKRANVAFSRARRRLVIVVMADTVTTLSGESVATVIDEARKLDAVREI
eukprot:gnl/Dysnectes_brevis/1030_a1148_668.p1 GENE.gnl/Dysnectes_brevis/1030_a1148_668~~gnl/Dysnectes_brevis/1030_a1148_668.p1  ORF type:complete len:1093 (+),score=242.33 gnl/Dysnectes_brevis/1030_a1148_668:599-3877(+)